MPELKYKLPRLILASQSIARKALLEELGIEVTTLPTHCDESFEPGHPDAVVGMLAKRKLQAYRNSHPLYTLPVLCCDTLIYFEENFIGKPNDRATAKSQLLGFSGKAQQVHSGWALWYEGQMLSGADKALVWFKTLYESTVEAYLETQEWVGAAGSYRIQGEGRHLIDHIEGDKGTVIGLPLLQLQQILGQNG